MLLHLMFCKFLSWNKFFLSLTTYVVTSWYLLVACYSTWCLVYLVLHTHQLHVPVAAQDVAWIFFSSIFFLTISACCCPLQNSILPFSVRYNTKCFINFLGKFFSHILCHKTIGANVSRGNEQVPSSLICQTKYELSKIPDLKDLNFFRPWLYSPPKNFPIFWKLYNLNNDYI